MLKLGVIKENLLNEKRVSLTPYNIYDLINLGFKIYVEKNAGLLSGYSNDLYIENGAIVSNYKNVIKSDILLKINTFSIDELVILEKNKILICLNFFSTNKFLKVLNKKKITFLILNKIPRISKAQYFDVLSTISHISGYRAVIEAFYEYRGFWSNQITASGNLNAIKILIIGVGVAGLSAISLSKALGADVYAYDIKDEVKLQIKSLGVKFFCEKNKNYSLNQLLLRKISLFDVLIIGALDKYGIAPKIINKDLLKLMKKNSILVDLSIKNGGNCELSIKNKIVIFNNVKIIGYEDYSNLMPYITSKLYGNNLVNFLKFILDTNNNVFINLNDNIIKKIVFTYKGVLNKNIKKKNIKEKKILKEKKKNFKLIITNTILVIIIILFLIFKKYNFIVSYFRNFIVFVISSILGFRLLNKVDYCLHSPLISITNAISGIIFLGFLFQINNSVNYLVNLISFFSLFLVNINIFAGFNLTRRMLNMFYKK